MPDPETLAVAPVPIPGFLTIAEAAEHVRCHPRTLVKQVRAGRLLATQIGGKRLLRADHFAAYLDACAAVPQ